MSYFNCNCFYTIYIQISERYTSRVVHRSKPSIELYINYSNIPIYFFPEKTQLVSFFMIFTRKCIYSFDECFDDFLSFVQKNNKKICRTQYQFNHPTTRTIMTSTINIHRKVSHILCLRLCDAVHTGKSIPFRFSSMISFIKTLYIFHCFVLLYFDATVTQHICIS